MLPLAVIWFVAAAVQTVGWIRSRLIDPEVLQAKQLNAAQRTVAYRHRLMASTPTVSYTLAVVLIVIAIVEFMWSRNVVRVVDVAGLVKPAVEAGQWWRLLTSTFLHANLFHLVSNVLALWLIGRALEALVPRWQVVVAYLLSGLAGGLASWWWAPTTPSIGASGAIMGLAGFLVVLGARQRGVMPQRDFANAVLMCLLNSGVYGLVVARIDSAAHVGGALAGALIAWIVVPRVIEPFAIDDAPALPARALGWAGALAVAGIAAGALGTTVLLAKAGGPSLTDYLRRPGDPPDVFIPVTSVAASARDDIGDRGMVFIGNRGTKTIEAIDIGSIRFSGSLALFHKDFCCKDSSSSDDLPIRAGERRMSPVEGNRRDTVVPTTVLLVAFDDGTFEGSTNLYRHLLDARRAELDDAEFFLGELDAMRSQSPADASMRVRRIIDERARWDVEQKRAFHDFGTSYLALPTAKNWGESYFSESLSKAIARVTQTRDRLRAHISPIH